MLVHCGGELAGLGHSFFEKPPAIKFGDGKPILPGISNSYIYIYYIY
jgi:hypothetical protein